MNTDIQQPLPPPQPQQQPQQQQHHHHHQIQIRFEDSNTAATASANNQKEAVEEDQQSINMGSKRVVGAIIRNGRRPSFVSNYLMFSPSKPSLFHAIVVIFLEFFAWGLLTLPAITVLNTTFPDRTFLMNGLVMGVKGFLSFLSAPLIGALSDVWGRKFFLLITVFFTCLPIPFMKFSPSLYFGLVIISGIFSVTFSVIFAYVADITEEHNRSYAYGWVTATFALSLITSPALGTFISTTLKDDNLVIVLATGVAIFDFIYILFFVPESLPEKLRQKSVSFWESADPFSALRRAGKDRMILTLCVAVFLSYLPEAGQYSCFFVYLKLVIGFSQVQVASYIALIGVMSVVAQTLFLAWFMKRFGSKNTIMIGLIFEMLQLICFGLGSSHWVVWSAGLLAAIGTITYPAISAYVSTYADADKQGLVQGIITGIRGLCNGLGPCFFGLVFSLFNVDLVKQSESVRSAVIGGVDTKSIRHMFPQTNPNGTMFMDFLNSTTNQFFHSTTEQVIPGPPFLFGSLLVLSAILVMAFIPELVQFPPSNGSYGESYLQSGSFKPTISRMMSPSRSSRTAPSNNYYYKNMQHQTDKDNQCCSIAEPDEMNDGKFLHNNLPLAGDDDDIDFIDDGDNITIDHEDHAINCARSSMSSVIASSLNTSNLSTTNNSTITPTSSPSPGSSASSPSQSSSEGDSDVDSKQRLISSSNNGSGDSRRHSIEYDQNIYQRQQQQDHHHQHHHDHNNQLMPPKPPKRHVRHNTIVMANTNHRTTTTAIHKLPSSFTNLGNNGNNHEHNPNNTINSHEVESRSLATNLNQSYAQRPSFLNKHLPSTTKTSPPTPFVRNHSKSLNATNLEQATTIMINNNNKNQTSSSATDILVKRLIQSVKT